MDKFCGDYFSWDEFKNSAITVYEDDEQTRTTARFIKDLDDMPIEIEINGTRAQIVGMQIVDGVIVFRTDFDEIPESCCNDEEIELTREMIETSREM